MEINSRFRLIIHHHDEIYREGEKLFLSAGIALWVDALAAHFGEIILLMPESTKRTKKQDTGIESSNVRFMSLGTKGRYWDRLGKIRRIRRQCREAAKQADGLLIRGMTPRQMTVWRYASVPFRAFLLVRSPKQKRLVNYAFLTIVAALVNQWREMEYLRIAQSENTTLLANSPVFVNEIKRVTGRKAFFAPTNTIRNRDILPLAHRSASANPKLLFVGRIHFMKGLRELLQALCLLEQDHGIHGSLDVVGTFEEPALSQLKEMAEKLGVSSRVKWLGRISFGPELFTKYKEADMFVLPTYSEGFPRVFWEAASMSCPVVISAVGGIPSILENRKHALLVEPKNVRDLVSAIGELTRNQQLRETLVQNAHHLSAGFTIENCALRLYQVLEEEWQIKK